MIKDFRSSNIGKPVISLYILCLILVLGTTVLQVNATNNQTSNKPNDTTVDQNVLFLLDDVSIDLQSAQLELNASNYTKASVHLENAVDRLSDVFTLLLPYNIQNNTLTIVHNSTQH